MNTFDLSKKFFDWAVNNPDLVRPIHGILYFYIIDLNNRLAWVEKFSLPSYNTMHSIGVSNYKTYSKALGELKEYGFIRIIQVSKNQHTACVVALVKNTKALPKQLPKQCSGTALGTVVINKPLKHSKHDDDVLKNSPTTSTFSISECRAKYDKEYIDAKIKICESHNILHTNLQIFQNTFDSELISLGKKEKDFKDYADHFAKWINKKGVEGRKKILSEHFDKSNKKIDPSDKYK